MNERTSNNQTKTCACQQFARPQRSTLVGLQGAEVTRKAVPCPLHCPLRPPMPTCPPQKQLALTVVARCSNTPARNARTHTCTHKHTYAGEASGTVGALRQQRASTGSLLDAWSQGLPPGVYSSGGDSASQPLPLRVRHQPQQASILTLHSQPQQTLQQETPQQTRQQQQQTLPPPGQQEPSEEHLRSSSPAGLGPGLSPVSRRTSYDAGYSTEDVLQARRRCVRACWGRGACMCVFLQGQK